MSVSKKALKNNSCKLKGALRKCGFDRWRYCFCGFNAASGEERTFFIELSVLNPAVSPSKPVFYDNRRADIDISDLQAALTGNIGTEKNTSPVVPGYCCIRTGTIGKNPVQLTRFLPCEKLDIQKKSFNISVGDCLFSDTELSGVQMISASDVQNLPSGKTDEGHMEWNLKYERVFDSEPVSSGKTVNWFPTGVVARFSGRVVCDGIEYNVLPDNSFGYTDKTWGVEMPSPFFHISSSRFSSIFSGSVMPLSGFALEGDFDGKVSLVSRFENEEYSFGRNKKIKKYDSSWSCIKTPSNDDGEELHWSVSLSCKKYIVDVDIFSEVNSLTVYDYDMPQGSSVLKVLGGGSASGEIRIYKKIKKSLELVQHAKIINSLVEYGVKDFFTES